MQISMRGSRRDGGGLGGPPPGKSESLRNTVMGPLKLPSQNSVSGYHWPSSETLFMREPRKFCQRGSNYDKVVCFT